MGTRPDENAADSQPCQFQSQALPSHLLSSPPTTIACSMELIWRCIQSFAVASTPRKKPTATKCLNLRSIQPAVLDSSSVTLPDVDRTCVVAIVRPISKASAVGSV